VDWQLSKVQPGSVRAFCFDERLIIRAIALLPPGHTTVEVHEAQGSHRVPILPLRVAAEAAGKAPAQVPRYTATGYSTTFSIDEAFRNAVGALPRATSPRPDELTHVVIDHIGATFCEATGLRQMYIIVSRSECTGGPPSPERSGEGGD
jgi:hypothetical protein